MKKLHLAIVLLLSLIAGCSDENEGNFETYNLKGYAQKGPYIVGSDVTVAELDKNLSPTGRVFFATILSDEGYFEIPNVRLKSDYVLVKVEGDYYNEAHDQFSIKQLTMYSLADVSQGNQINVNLLTHLQRERIEHLVQEEGLSFSAAKNQAYGELLAVFSLQGFNPSDPELINILEDNASAAILLTVSSIISDVVNEYDNDAYADWLEMLTNFQLDLADDGVLDDELLGNQFLTTAGKLNVSRIMSDMQDEFTDADIPDFTIYINHFISNSNFTNYFEGLFPEGDAGAINILNLASGTTLSPGTTYVIRAEVPAELEIYYSLDININEVGQGDVAFGGNLIESDGQQNHLLISWYENSDVASITIPVTFTGTGSMTISIDAYMANVVKEFNNITLHY